MSEDKAEFGVASKLPFGRRRGFLRGGIEE